MIFGYTISGDIVKRDTVLYDKWRVYDAESKGLLYLKEIEEGSFQITFPFLYLYKSSWKGEGTGLLPVTALDKDHLNFRDIEYVDIEMIAFNIWWYFKKNPKSDTFTLDDVFPKLNFKFGNLPFKKPKEFTLAATKRKFDGNWDKLVEENWTFGITTPTDTTVDSFAILYSNTNEIWKLLIQSKLRKSGSGDHDFSDKDLTQQLGYLKQMGITDNNWIMIIRTDSDFKATIPKEYVNNIMPIDYKILEHYYGPVIYHAREVSRLQMIGETWDDLIEKKKVEAEELVIRIPKIVIEEFKRRLEGVEENKAKRRKTAHKV
jgi:hypothetical protein